MSKEKFTQGEWLVQKVTLQSGGKVNEVVTDNYDVASTFLGVRRVSDAHLIAAAPDMYRMLNDIVEDLESTDFRALSARIEASHKAKKLLAKARGEQNG